jgi:O-methyltransferase involved in polyketide biosynthesis
MYLNRDAMRATLAEVSARSAPRSRLAVTYSTPGPAVTAASRTLFRALGEPILGAITPEDLARELRDAGFDVLSDTGAVDWARAHGGFSARVGRLFGGERLAVCARS